MNDRFICGLMLGIFMGAVIMHSSPKAQQLMEKGKQELKEQINKI